MDKATERIREAIEHNIQYYAVQPESEARRRCKELDEEWDIERWLETNASTLALTGAVLGLTSNRKWFLLSAGVMGFLFQHAVQGWCPPLPIFRRMGVRTREEIDREKYGIRLVRGELQSAEGFNPS